MDGMDGMDQSTEKTAADNRSDLGPFPSIPPINSWTMRCEGCPAPPDQPCVAMATNCARLCELARVNLAYRDHVARLSGSALETPRAAAAAPALDPEADALGRVFACPHRDRCGCSTVECKGGKHNGRRVSLATCLACVAHP